MSGARDLKNMIDLGLSGGILKRDLMGKFRNKVIGKSWATRGMHMRTKYRKSSYAIHKHITNHTREGLTKI